MERIWLTPFAEKTNYEAGHSAFFTYIAEVLLASASLLGCVQKTSSVRVHFLQLRGDFLMGGCINTAGL